MENFTNQLDAILNKFIWEEMNVKKMKQIKRALLLLKKQVVSGIKETRKFLKEELYWEIRKTKDYISNNVKKRTRKTKEIITKPSIVQEVEAPAIDPIPQEELNTSNPV